VRRLALAAAALTATPGCARDSTPAPAAGGVTAAIVAAIEQGDEAALLRITRGSISNRLTAQARGSGLVRISPAELFALTRGCPAHDPTEPNGGAFPAEPGGVEFRCEGRPAADNRCDDRGYGLLIKPQAGYARVEVWPADSHSRSRCGEPRPPPPPPPLPRTPSR